MHQTPLLCIFYLNYPSPPGIFFTPLLAYPTLHCFASTAPIPQIRFCLTPPPLDFFSTIYMYTPGSFTNVRHTLLHFISTYPPPPHVLSSLPLSGIPSYSFAPATPPSHFIFATFRTPDFSQPPLQFCLLYTRKLVSCVVHLVCFWCRKLARTRIKEFQPP